MSSLLLQKTGPDTYTVTDTTHVGRKAKPAELNVFSWDELCEYILKETPFPSRIFPTLKTQLDNGMVCPLNF